MTMTKVPQRSLEEPRTERNADGAEIAFTELLTTNIAVIKQNLRTPKLKIKYFDIGEIAKTKVAVLYVDGIADQSIVSDVTSRITGLKIRWIPNHKVIADELQDGGLRPFNGYMLTERFDGFVAHLMEGRVGVIVDNSPLGIICPYLFFENFTATGDYNSDLRRFSGRLLRLTYFLFTVYVPALYVDINRYHMDKIPKKLNQVFHGGGPWLTGIEVVIMLYIIKIMIDSTFRINKNTNIVFSILCGSVITVIASDIKLINPYAVLIVAFAELVGFSLNRRLGAAISVLQILMIITARIFDWYGLAVVTMALILRLCVGRTFGIPFMFPLIPADIKHWNDTIFFRGKLKTIINKNHRILKKKDK